jgi:hypothetical protein
LFQAIQGDDPELTRQFLGQFGVEASAEVVPDKVRRGRGTSTSLWLEIAGSR